MKICKNCTKFYVANDDYCLNCGVIGSSLGSAKKRRLIGSILFTIHWVSLLLLCVTIMFGIFFFDNEKIYRDFGLLLMGVAIIHISLIVSIPLLNRYFHLDVFTPVHELAETPLVSDHPGESLINWEERLGGKLKDVSHSLAELKKHKNDIAPLLRHEEIDGLASAEAMLEERERLIKMKINALFVARWLNEVEYLFYLARTAQNNDEIDAWLTKTKVIGPKATGLVKQDLEPAVREDVEAAMKSIEYLKARQLRRKSLNFAQSVRADEIKSTRENETSERIAGQAARLRLNESSLEPVTADMFLKETFRLEILEILE